MTRGGPTLLEDLAAFVFDPFDPDRNLALVESILALPGLAEAASRLAGAPPPEDWTADRVAGEEGSLAAAWVAFVSRAGGPKDLQEIGVHFDAIADYVRPFPGAAPPAARALALRHDLLHALTGAPATPEGEVWLQGLVVGTGRPDLFSLLAIAALPISAFASGRPASVLFAWTRGLVEGRRWGPIARLALEDLVEEPVDSLRALFRKDRPGRKK